ncbi:MAG TPA: hypothetical protein VIN04_11860 [Myxococcota bacterium]
MDGTVLLALVGQVAFIGASLALGVKLIALWRRTRQLPELCVGLSFLLSGGLGYLAWFLLGVAMLHEASPQLRHALAASGLACSGLGAIANGIGNARIFRPGRVWPLVFVGMLGAGMAVGFGIYVRAASGHASFWIGPLLSLPIFVWGATEALTLWSVLRRRARLGLADPLVVNRTGQWGVASLAVALMVAITVASRLLHGVYPPAWVSAAGSGLCLVAALAIWLGFFPPRAFRERLARAYAA